VGAVSSSGGITEPSIDGTSFDCAPGTLNPDEEEPRPDVPLVNERVIGKPAANLFSWALGLEAVLVVCEEGITAVEGMVVEGLEVVTLC